MRSAPGRASRLVSGSYRTGTEPTEYAPDKRFFDPNQTNIWGVDDPVGAPLLRWFGIPGGSGAGSGDVVDVAAGHDGGAVV